MSDVVIERLLTVQEIAEVLQVPQSWVYTKTKVGHMPHLRVGRYLRFRVGEVLAWIRRQEEA